MCFVPTCKLLVLPPKYRPSSWPLDLVFLLQPSQTHQCGSMSEGKDDVPSFWVSNKPGDEQMKLFVEGLARDLANRYNPRPDIVFIRWVTVLLHGAGLIRILRGPPHTGTTTSTIANEPMHVTLSAVWIG
jgi:hypothetical protein